MTFKLLLHLKGIYNELYIHFLCVVKIVLINYYYQ